MTGPAGPLVAVVGATGFIGSEVVAALEHRGARVRRVQAPRLSTPARDLARLTDALDLSDHLAARDELSAELAGCDAVVNAAGIPAATSDGDALFGANALLAGVVACAAPVEARLVHVSSAAVQGRRERLDETTDHLPFTPYSSAKALGEQLVARRAGETVCFRPTSVHGPGRQVTRTLARVLRSPLASVAGTGERPTPQVLVGNVASAIAFVALCAEAPPGVVLQPGEGMTTGGLVRLLGGREPRHLPEGLARTVVGLGYTTGRRSGAASGVARRLEMMWFGQDQCRGWLADRWSAPFGLDTWKELR